MDIESFIEKYTQSEVEKIERKDTPLTRFNQHMMVQKIAITQADEKRESSPIRSPQRPSSIKKTASIASPRKTDREMSKDNYPNIKRI